MDDDVFMVFTTYATIVLLKMLFMGPLTAYYRITRGVCSPTYALYQDLHDKQTFMCSNAVKLKAQRHVNTISCNTQAEEI